MYSKTTLIGRLGKDPDQRYSQSGTAVTTFSMATTEKYKGEETTTWHNIVAFGKLAEITGEYLNKGSFVLIEGRIQHRSYERDGETKYISEIVAREMKMLDSRGSSTRTDEKPFPVVPPDTDVPC